MIALDAMGGDFAPHKPLEGAVRAARRGVSVCVFGNAAVLEEVLTAIDSEWRSLPLHIEHTTEEIGMDEEPASAVRKKQDSSLVRAVRSIKEGRCSAAVSAGGSGALMIASLFILGRQEGVERPAIAAIFPTKQGPVLVLDIGANTDCKPHYLRQFADLGVAFVREHFQLNNPRIGLLANGHEDSKGSLLTKETFPLLKESGLNFIGNVEPYNVFAGDVDVVVTDGFSGNVMIKTVESVHDLILSMAKNAVEESGLGNSSGFDLMKNAINKRFLDGNCGGAPLLGVRGDVIVCHGAASAEDIERALVFVNEK